MSLPQRVRSENSPPRFAQRGEVHVWEIPHEGPANCEQLLQSLSPEERARAERFRIAEKRANFIYFRARLREILSLYLQTPAKGVSLGLNPHGKPYLLSNEPLAFSLSHRGEWGLLAITQLPNRTEKINFPSGRLGVDLEILDSTTNFAALARQTLSPREFQSFSALSPLQQPATLLQIWTLKEAFLKGVGEGLARPLPDIEVDLYFGRPVLLATGDASDSPQDWQLTSWSPRENSFASLAVPNEYGLLPLVFFSATLLKDRDTSSAEAAVAHSS